MAGICSSYWIHVFFMAIISFIDFYHSSLGSVNGIYNSANSPVLKDLALLGVTGKVSC